MYNYRKGYPINVKNTVGGICTKVGSLGHTSYLINEPVMFGKHLKF